MKKHNGMRPHDILVLLKIISLGEYSYLKDLSNQLGISPSEITESVNRSVLAGLIAQDKKTVMRNTLYEFLIHGLPYVFPQKPGAIVPGIPTAHSAPPLNKEFKSSEMYVWPDPKGEVKGQEIIPFHQGQLNAAKDDLKLYELLALTDALRVGKAREKQLAAEELRKRIL
ncbi:hypothetical protein [uncultured Cytophaga sp.]|uniref:hypothetical protein n=1 Tax=uncultured Cytophaga sp. TaxID=160238 RepID=UPI00262240BC|nr:hypothetical protein [uncultured Cytophaga sp.]